MVFDAAKRGLVLWFEQLIPSLLPFLIFSNLLLSLTETRRSFLPKTSPGSVITQRLFGLSPLGLYVLFMGHFCGYPAGAKITSDLYSKNRLSRKEADFLLAIANQSSPAFIGTYLTSYILGQKSRIIPVFFIFYGSTIITAVVLRFLPFQSREETCRLVCAEAKPSLMQILDYSITDAFSAMVRVGGYVILFSIFSTFSMQLFSGTGNIRFLLSASLEITNGLSLIKSAPFSTHSKWILAMACTAFGGFSAMAQIKGMLIGTPLSIKPYIIGKCIYTIVVVLMSELFFLSFPF